LGGEERAVGGGAEVTGRVSEADSAHYDKRTIDAWMLMSPKACCCPKSCCKRRRRKTRGTASIQGAPGKGMLSTRRRRRSRRPVIQAWADHVTGEANGKVVPIKPAQPTSKTGYAVVLSRGAQKGAVVSKHRSFDAALKAAGPGGVKNWSVRELDEHGAPKLADASRDAK
jgi:hypothetical protein